MSGTQDTNSTLPTTPSNRAERRSAAIAARHARDPLPLSIGGNYSVVDAARLTGISRSLIYSLISSGKLRSAKVAGRRLVPAAAIIDLISESE